MDLCSIAKSCTYYNLIIIHTQKKRKKKKKKKTNKQTNNKEIKYSTLYTHLYFIIHAWLEYTSWITIWIPSLSERIGRFSSASLCR